MDERIALLSAGRHGIFSRNEVLSVGATRGLIERRLAARRWERLALGVYRLNGAPETWRQRLLVACLAAGDTAVGSHRSAAALRQLAGIEHAKLEMTVPRWRRRRLAGVVVHEGLLPAATLQSWMRSR